MYTPKAHGLVYDPPTKTFSLFVKFGDGGPERINNYYTHNPTFNSSHRKEDEQGTAAPSTSQKGSKKGKGTTSKTNLGKGKSMEFRLQIAMNKDDFSGKIVQVPVLEWFQIFVGKDSARAEQAKIEFCAMLDKYEKLPLDEDAEEEFGDKFIALIAKYGGGGPPPVDTKAARKKRKKLDRPSTDQQGGTPSPPKKSKLSDDDMQVDVRPQAGPSRNRRT
ncbi:hypothetical protein H0H92_006384 [Tricholoma furcatifolium]|nr:hypothetical protein H0H92_006384 [Tricholoma furcatifolium]